MGSELSSCCVLTPSPTNKTPQNTMIYDGRQRSGLNGCGDMTLNDLIQAEKNAIKAVFDLVVAGEPDALETAIREAPIDISDISWKNGLSPLHIAAMKGNFCAVEILVKHGFEPNKLDHLGRTALHWAGRNKHVTVYRFLRPITTNAHIADVYGITAASFFDTHLVHGICVDSDREEGSVALLKSTTDTSTSQLGEKNHNEIVHMNCDSLTLQTISLTHTPGANENSPEPCSPRSMDVSLSFSPRPPTSTTITVSSARQDTAESIAACGLEWERPEDICSPIVEQTQHLSIDTSSPSTRPADDEDSRKDGASLTACVPVETSIGPKDVSVSPVNRYLRYTRRLSLLLMGANDIRRSDRTISQNDECISKSFVKTMSTTDSSFMLEVGENLSIDDSDSAADDSPSLNDDETIVSTTSMTTVETAEQRENCGFERGVQSNNGLKRPEKRLRIKTLWPKFPAWRKRVMETSILMILLLMDMILFLIQLDFE